MKNVKKILGSPLSAKKFGISQFSDERKKVGVFFAFTRIQRRKISWTLKVKDKGEGMRTALMLVALLLSTVAVADPLEVVLSSDILSAVDHKNNTQSVLKGNKVRVRADVKITVKGYTSGSLREWLANYLPKNVRGYFEREDLSNGLVTRYKPLSFALRPSTIRCRRDEQPEFRVCEANYGVSATNMVDVPAGEAHEQAMALQMLPITSVGFPVRMAKAERRVYRVMTGEPTLSQGKFAGLPQI